MSPHNRIENIHIPPCVICYHKHKSSCHFVRADKPCNFVNKRKVKQLQLQGLL